MIYLCHISRIQSLNEVNVILHVISSKNVNDECKQYNESHVVCLPNVFFIGASKCGTTAMVDILSKISNDIKFVQRRIIPRDRHREVHQFDRKSYRQSWKYLERAFEWGTSPPVENYNESIVIHYTPHYLYAPSVPFDLRNFHTNWQRLKFIVILREPIERAWSSYWFHKSHLLNDKDGGKRLFIPNCCYCGQL